MGFIYFIQAKSGPIKIGFTIDPARRLKTFIVGHYEPLTYLGVIPGTKEDEQRLHLELKNSHIHGEWFQPTEEVLSRAAKADPAPREPLPLSARVALPHERTIIENAISKADGNIGKAAVILGCARRTLQNRMRSLGMPEGKAGRPHKVLGTADRIKLDNLPNKPLHYAEGVPQLKK